MTSEELVTAKARDEIIKAAQELCSLLSEEDWNEIISNATIRGTIDTKTSYRVMGKLIDLGIAVQEYGS